MLFVQVRVLRHIAVDVVGSSLCFKAYCSGCCWSGSVFWYTSLLWMLLVWVCVLVHIIAVDVVGLGLCFGTHHCCGCCWSGSVFWYTSLQWMLLVWVCVLVHIIAVDVVGLGLCFGTCCCSGCCFGTHHCSGSECWIHNMLLQWLLSVCNGYYRSVCAHLPSPKNSVAQSSSLKIAQLVSQCCSRGQMGCNTATVPASVHFIVACVVYYLNDPVSASCEVFVVSSVVASRLATAFLTGN